MSGAMSGEGITIRAATIEDLPAIVGLLADDEIGRTRENASLPLAPEYVEAFDEIAADPNNILAVAAGEDGAICGVLQLTILPGIARMGAKRGQIEGVRVARERRGERLGERMFRWAIETCRARGCRLVQLTSDRERSGAHQFYERLGFEPTHVGYKLQIPDEGR